MRDLTEYEQSRIKDSIKLSKKFSSKETRKDIKKALKKSLTHTSALSIYDFLKDMLMHQTMNALDSSDCLYKLDYAHCTIIAIKHLNRAVHDMRERME